MKIRRSDLKLIVEEVMNEAPGLAKQTKGLHRGSFGALDRDPKLHQRDKAYRDRLGATPAKKKSSKGGGLAQQTKGLAKGAVTGPPPNHKQITKLSGGTNGWSGLIDKLDRNVAALKKAKAIDVSTAHALDKAISKMTKDFRAGAKAQGEKWKKTGKQ